VSDHIEITVNGETRRAPAGLSVRALLEVLGVTADRVAVELNRVIVRKPDWDHTLVVDGARIEIVQFVGGG
jgi:thiamine biosynthesis protein ThiS